MTWLRPGLLWQGHLGLSSLVAALPLFFLFWALTVQRMKGYLAALSMLGVGLAIALFLYKMPFLLAAMSILSGAFYAFMPIIWIVVPAVWLYQMAVKSGYFEKMVSSILSLTRDIRLQALLVAYVLGSFLEGTAGFGVPVAICAALLIGMGFEPVRAAVICLFANTAAVAFAGVGIPLLALEGPTGFPANEISRAVAYLLPCLSFVVPFLVAGAAAGYRRILEVWPAVLLVAASYTITASLTSAFLGPELPALLAAFVSLISLAGLLMVWKPKTQCTLETSVQLKADGPQQKSTLRSWSPFLILTGLVLVWGIPSIKAALSGSYKGESALLMGLNHIGEWFSFHPAAPFLHQRILTGSAGQPMDVYWKFEVLSLAGTAVWLVCFMSKRIYGLTWREMGGSFKDTMVKLKWSLLTIVTVTGFAYLSNYSGMSSTLGTLFAKTEGLFPLVSPILGWIGVFITGSDTSANLLFGPLQSVTAQTVGMDPLLALAANTVGGGAGKMVSMQSITIAAAAVGLSGKESDMLRKTLPVSILMVMLVALLTYSLS